MDIGRSGEMTNMRLKELKKSPGAEEEINALKYNKRAESEKQRKPRDDVRSCSWRCTVLSLPSLRKTCKNCGRQNHFAQVCLQKKSTRHHSSANMVMQSRLPMTKILFIQKESHHFFSLERINDCHWHWLNPTMKIHQNLNNNFTKNSCKSFTTKTDIFIYWVWYKIVKTWTRLGLAMVPLTHGPPSSIPRGSHVGCNQWVSFKK